MCLNYVIDLPPEICMTEVESFTASEVNIKFTVSCFQKTVMYSLL